MSSFFFSGEKVQIMLQRSYRKTQGNKENTNKPSLSSVFDAGHREEKTAGRCPSSADALDPEPSQDSGVVDLHVLRRASFTNRRRLRRAVAPRAPLRDLQKSSSADLGARSGRTAHGRSRDRRARERGAADDGAPGNPTARGGSRLHQKPNRRRHLHHSDADRQLTGSYTIYTPDPVIRRPPAARAA